jgi:putative Mg2+ transporter-C (MgtC) family protein
VAAGILTGMGFLGGAGIIRQENAVRGVTTAAVLWYVTVLGLAFGSGFLRLGLIGLGIALVTLYILPRIESKIENDFYALLTVRLRMDGPGVDELRSAITRLGVSVKRQEIDVDLTLRERTVRFELKFKKPAGFDLSRKVIDYCTQQAGVLQAKWI